MKLRRLQIKNFRGIKNLDLDLDDTTRARLNQRFALRMDGWVPLRRKLL
jgi:hypothetical protein